MDVLDQNIFFDEFFRDVREFDTSAFGLGEMGLEVKQNYVKSGKFSDGTRDDAIGNQFYHL